MTQPLAALLHDVAAGRYPPPDGRVTILPQPSPRDAGVISFTCHSVVFADADPAWIRGQLAPGDISAPLRPAFLAAMAATTGREPQSTDILCVASARSGTPAITLSPALADRHPRVERALRYRDEVRVWQAAGGIVLLGRGVAGRWEVAVEVDLEHRGKGVGRALAAAARHLVPGGAPLWAQISPGNATSARAFLAAGFRPVGAEALLALPCGRG